jgi:hypothetical protein
MKKEEIIWLLIRIAGLYLLFESLQETLALFSSFLVALKSTQLMTVSAGVFIQAILRILLLTSVGLYLVFNGSLVFHLLNRQPDAEDLS